MAGFPAGSPWAKQSASAPPAGSPWAQQGAPPAGSPWAQQGVGAPPAGSPWAQQSGPPAGSPWAQQSSLPTGSPWAQQSDPPTGSGWDQQSAPPTESPWEQQSAPSTGSPWELQEMAAAGLPPEALQEIAASGLSPAELQAIALKEIALKEIAAAGLPPAGSPWAQQWGPPPPKPDYMNMWAQTQTDAVEAQAHVAVNAAVANFSKSFQSAAESYSGPSKWASYGEEGVSGGQTEVVAEEWDNNALLPEVAELCKRFDIDDNRAYQLNELLQPRAESRDEDMQRLWNDLERSRNPMGLLITKIKQLREGSFKGQWLKPDPEMQHFKRKFELDSEASRRLEECVSRHTAERRQKYYVELELHLEASHNPSGLIMLMLKKLASGEDLGPVKEQGGPAGKGKAKKGKEDSKRDGRRGSRTRSRSRRDRRDRRQREDEETMSRFRESHTGGDRDRGRRDDRDDRRDRDRDGHRNSDRGDDRGRHDDRGRNDRDRDDRRGDPDASRSSGDLRGRDDYGLRGDRPAEKPGSDSQKPAEKKSVWTAPKIKIT